MAEWKIDSIMAITKGAPEARYADVFITDGGIVSARPVPGKTFIGNVSLSNFHKVFRTPNIFPVPITEFCNYVTHVNYRAYAQNDFPFVYVQDDLNSEKCGYLAPPPKPAVPPNPFGNPFYGEYSFFNYCDVEGNQIEVKFRKKNYLGSVKEFLIGGKSPVVLTKANMEDKDLPWGIQKTECKINLVQIINFEMKEFYTEDERMFQVEVLINGETEFKGYTLPDDSQEDFSHPKNEVFIRCTDGLTQLKEATYPVPLGGSNVVRQSFKDIICYCLAPLNLNLDVSTIVNLYSSKNKMSLDDDPLAQNSVNPLSLTDDKGSLLTCYEVLNNIATLFKARFSQDNGKWVMVRTDELARASARRRTYDYGGLFLFSDVVSTNRLIGGSLR